MPDEQPVSTTIQTFVTYALEYPDPDGDWVLYGHIDNEEGAVRAIEDLRTRTPSPWRITRHIVTKEVLDV